MSKRNREVTIELKDDIITNNFKFVKRRKLIEEPFKFNELPPEIKTMVLRSLDFRSLINLSMTCKNFSKILPYIKGNIIKLFYDYYIHTMLGYYGKIKNGNILKWLVEYSEYSIYLQTRQISGNKKVIGFNKKAPNPIYITLFKDTIKKHKLYCEINNTNTFITGEVKMNLTVSKLKFEYTYTKKDVKENCKMINILINKKNISAVELLNNQNFDVFYAYTNGDIPEGHEFMVLFIDNIFDSMKPILKSAYNSKQKLTKHLKNNIGSIIAKKIEVHI